MAKVKELNIDNDWKCLSCYYAANSKINTGYLINNGNCRTMCNEKVKASSNKGYIIKCDKFKKYTY